MRPPVNPSSNPTTFRKVVLPDPDAPATKTNSPSLILIETPRRAWVSTKPWRYIFERARISIKNGCLEPNDMER